MRVEGLGQNSLRSLSPSLPTPLSADTGCRLAALEESERARETGERETTCYKPPPRERGKSETTGYEPFELVVPASATQDIKRERELERERVCARECPPPQRELPVHHALSLVTGWDGTGPCTRICA